MTNNSMRRSQRLSCEPLENRNLLATLLSVDVDSNRAAWQQTSPSPTQDGFQQMIEAGSFDSSIGTISARLTPIGGGSLGHRDRNAENWKSNDPSVNCLCSVFDGPYGHLLSDFLQSENGATGLNLALGGLEPKTKYLLRIFSYDDMDPGKRFDVLDANAQRMLFDDFVTRMSMPSDLNGSFLDVVLRSSPTGRLSVNMVREESSPGDSVPLNGFELQDIPVGDTNLDGAFDQFDIINVLQAGKYGTGQTATFFEGDWNCDGLFNQLNIIESLQHGLFRDWFVLNGDTFAFWDNTVFSCNASECEAISGADVIEVFVFSATGEGQDEIYIRSLDGSVSRYLGNGVWQSNA